MPGPLSRRAFLTATAGAAAFVATVNVHPEEAFAQGPYAPPPLPYPETDLEPYISAKTISFHHGKHTAAYYTNTAKLLEGKPLHGKPLTEVFLEAYKDKDNPGLFNNAAQSWNHTFYWNSMKKGGGGEPSGRLGDAVKAAFGGFEGFKKAFSEAAATQFASGWAWLVLDKTELKVVKTGNAANPQVSGQTPLLTIDVWEHAYYLDHQNRRADYIKAFLDNLVNWDFVAKNFG